MIDAVAAAVIVVDDVNKVVDVDLAGIVVSAVVGAVVVVVLIVRVVVVAVVFCLQL